MSGINTTWPDAEKIRRVLRKSTLSALVLLIIVLPLFLIFLYLSSTLKNEAFEQAMIEINENGKVNQYLGEPIQAGYFVMGDLSQSSDGSGKANLRFSVHGSKKTKARAFVIATKELGRWRLDQVVVSNHAEQVQIYVINGG